MTLHRENARAAHRCAQFQAGIWSQPVFADNRRRSVAARGCCARERYGISTLKSAGWMTGVRGVRGRYYGRRTPWRQEHRDSCARCGRTGATIMPSRASPASGNTRLFVGVGGQPRPAPHQIQHKKHDRCRRHYESSTHCNPPPIEPPALKARTNLITAGPSVTM